MAFDAITNRTDASALIPEEVVDDWLSSAARPKGAARSLFRPIPVARNQVRMPVLGALPTAYFVSGDTGLKQSTDLSWKNKFINVEEIAVIVPIPENVVDDVDYDIWAQAEGPVIEAIDRCLDDAIFFGVNAPASWPSDVVTAATAAGNSVAEGDSAATGGFFGDLDELFGALEADGFDASGVAMARSAKSRFRSARNTLGDRLDATRVNPQFTEIDGSPIVYPMRGLWPGSVRAIAGDFAGQFVLGIRKDVSLKMLDQAVIQDNTGAIIYNLAQQDMVAARLTFRAGWQVANVVNQDQPVEANRYPAAVLTY